MACVRGDSTLGPTIPDGWDIPKEGISIGCSGGRDCIPSLNNPEVIPADSATFLSDGDLVLGLVVNREPRAYPIQILNYHEIVNDVVGGIPVAITYSPLTGTGLAFDPLVAVKVLDFGVSGLLYNNNLIMYDRNTGSHWTQMRMRADQGPLRGTRLFTWPLMQITWGGWRRLHPDTKVLSRNTGFPRDYSTYPYGDYPTNHDYLLFPLLRDDSRLPRKTVVHGIVMSASVKVWKHEDFTQQEVLNEQVGSQPVVIIADPALKLVVSYSRAVPPGLVLTFRISFASNRFPFALRDEQTQSLWDIQGRAFSGPLAGTTLQQVTSFNGYWFAWAAIFGSVEIAER
jgi:hypothetical protein